MIRRYPPKVVVALGFDPSQEHPSDAKEFIRLSPVQQPRPYSGSP